MCVSHMSGFALGHDVGVAASVDSPAATSRGFALVGVRRRDARRLREFGPPPGTALPAKHGGKDDPRYPSPHTLRYGLGVIVDLILHLACAVLVVVAAARDHALPIAAIVLAGPVTFIAVSMIHRILVQRIVHTTLGKALTGVEYIRDDTGGAPTAGALTKAWFFGALMVILNVLSGF